MSLMSLMSLAYTELENLAEIIRHGERQNSYNSDGRLIQTHRLILRGTRDKEKEVRKGMEVKLFDGSKLTFEPTRDGGMSIQLWSLGNWKDGHGFMLTSGAIVDGEQLRALMDALNPPP